MKIRRSVIWLGLVSIFSTTAAIAATSPCAGQYVYANNGHDLVGKVTRIYGERAEVNWRYVDSKPVDEIDYADISQLSVRVPCQGSICNGTMVYGNNGSDLTGVVHDVFENGQVEVRWLTANGERLEEKGSYNFWPASRLSIQTECK